MPNRASSMVSFRISISDLERLTKAAAKEEVTVSAFVRRLVVAALDGDAESRHAAKLQDAQRVLLERLTALHADLRNVVRALHNDLKTAVIGLLVELKNTEEGAALRWVRNYLDGRPFEES